ncbi:helix-turn-helix domain-containing protein [Deinococcus peraridilitoris]|uniref:Helix-turn-helix protein n=1 Tax=Deinococcus peraridilitoris (strain DSM 19664 / LMG 22246 / CIP 109416 / KR-200) TaxID=937777 RepID=K9ZY48_DEIPD|nr:helix-turn-helix transcriptional regulator [Deinococcus peraridilitoris]AFZ66099.1 Helix-turn-helix protein [Deinococcus peraridilitoris DSM 19664]
MFETATPRAIFSQRLRTLRSERELSTFAVAEGILGSRDRASEVTKWESGKHFPAPENLVKIADFFSCSTDYLLGVTDDRQTVKGAA